MSNDRLLQFLKKCHNIGLSLCVKLTVVSCEYKTSRLVDAVPDEGMGRIARFFLLGGQDASNNNYNNNNQYGNNFGLGNKDTSNLLNLNLNSREIQEVDIKKYTTGWSK